MINPHSLLLEYHYGNAASNLVSVEGNPSLKRDQNTNAIVNTNTQSYEEYIRNRENRQAQQSEIDSIKQEIAELKSLILQVLNK
jgi:hypothetical protein